MITDYSPEALLDHFTQPEFAFLMRGWKEPNHIFFAPTAANQAILTERRHWLSQDPQRYLVWQPESAGLVRATLQLAKSFDSTFNFPDSNASPQEGLQALGLHWEPDILLVRRCADSEIRMQAGVVCFASHWSPQAKLGQTVEVVHGPVPGLNAAIAPGIQNLLVRLQEGYSWLRVNLALSASLDLNQHPELAPPRLTRETPMESIWLRVEYQALATLPGGEGVLFGIRPYHYELNSLLARPQAARAVIGQLRTMPLAVQEYKGIEQVSARVADWLEARL